MKQTEEAYPITTDEKKDLRRLVAETIKRHDANRDNSWNQPEVVKRAVRAHQAALAKANRAVVQAYLDAKKAKRAAEKAMNAKGLNLNYDGNPCLTSDEERNITRTARAEFDSVLMDVQCRLALIRYPSEAKAILKEVQDLFKA